MKIYKDISQLVGGTPLVELGNIEKAHGIKATIAAKLESFNPAGSAKDRIALEMLNQAEAKGELKPGGTVIEPTSGNTGIGLAAFAAVRGYRMIIVMPDNMSLERQKLMKAYGAELVLTPGAEGMTGSIAKAEELKREIPGSIVAGQFSNKANPEAHRKTTGPEIWNDTDGRIDIFVCGVGTGGTVTGTGEYLKSKNPDIKIVGVEPAGSPVLSGGKAGAHGLQGIGAGFVPEVLNTEIYDEIITVTDEAAYVTGRELAAKEGILAGITSGASCWAAMELAKRPENQGKLIVAFMTDTGERYLSSPMFSE